MRRWLGETLRTFSVTTVHPVGWSLSRIKTLLAGERFRARPRQTAPLAVEREMACPVLLVHGIFHNATAFYGLSRRLRKRGFRAIHTIELRTSVDEMETMIGQLKWQVIRLHEAHTKKKLPGKIRIVAHSLGGMVTRAALLDSEFARRVDKVIFLGTPHQGNAFYRLPIPRCLRAFSDDSPLMQRLRIEPLPPGIRYWNLRGGNLDLVTLQRDTFLPHVPNVIFDHVGHAGLLSDRHVIRSVATLLETPSTREDPHFP